VNLQALAERLGFEPDEFSELADLFVETETGELAEMKAAVASGDADAAAKKAHSLKGAAGNLGFTKIHELAQTLDQLTREKKLEEASVLIQQIEEQLDLLKQLLDAI
jgi:HPt (histidine-containing phosphotransfer) domain-containing protein